MIDQLADLRRSNLAAWLVATTLVTLIVLTPFLPDEFRSRRPLAAELAVRPAVAAQRHHFTSVAEQVPAWESPAE